MDFPPIVGESSVIRLADLMPVVHKHKTAAEGGPRQYITDPFCDPTCASGVSICPIWFIQNSFSVLVLWWDISRKVSNIIHEGFRVFFCTTLYNRSSAWLGMPGLYNVWFLEGHPCCYFPLCFTRFYWFWVICICQNGKKALVNWIKIFIDSKMLQLDQYDQSVASSSLVI